MCTFPPTDRTPRTRHPLVSLSPCETQSPFCNPSRDSSRRGSLSANPTQTRSMPQLPPSREGTLGANASGHPAARGTAKPPQGHRTLPLSACQMHVLHLRNLCLCLGFILNEEKYDLMPSQTFNFLGMNFNTTTMLVSPSPQRLQRLHELLSGLYRQT
ncbi:hypothetical protein ACOMHN_017080 [Nucella lapillus]